MSVSDQQNSEVSTSRPWWRKKRWWLAVLLISEALVLGFVLKATGTPRYHIGGPRMSCGDIGSEVAAKEGMRIYIETQGNSLDLGGRSASDVWECLSKPPEQRLWRRRRGGIDFDTDQYLANYDNLRAAFADGQGGYDETAAMLHFIQHGFGEGRTDNPLVA